MLTDWLIFASFTHLSTAAVALWLERPREVTGSIPGRDRRKSLKAGSCGFPPWRSGLWELQYDWHAIVR